MYETLHKCSKNYIVFGDSQKTFADVHAAFGSQVSRLILFWMEDASKVKKSTLLREGKRIAHKEKVKLITAQLATLDRSQDPEGYRNLALKRDALRRSALSPPAELFVEFKDAVREKF